MQPAKERDDEPASLQALQDLNVLDSSPEASFDALVRVAAMVCNTPISTLSLIDTDRQWFKAAVGLPGITETPRDQSFCGHAVLGDDIFVVPDATLDSRFADNPLVTGHPYIRYYAGSPIRLSNGSCVGTVCVIDHAPRRLDASQTQILRHLAKAGAQALEGRQALNAVLGSEAAAHRAASELTRQQAVFRAALDSLEDAVITTDALGHVEWLNSAAEHLTGCDAHDARGAPLTRVLQLVEPETRRVVDPLQPADAETGPHDARAGQAVLLAPDGHEFLVEHRCVSVHYDDGSCAYEVVVIRDLSEHSRMSGEMSHRATHDELTGLVNRAEFERRLLTALKDSKHDGVAHAIISIDLDQFRVVNDACGHAAGDRMLQQVADILTDAVRATDTVARIDGDEFAVIMMHCSAEHAHRAAQAICDRMDRHRFIHDERRFRIGTSIGLVPVDARWPTIAEILHAAEASCLAARDAGGNRVHAWHDSDQTVHVRQGEMQWATRIEHALDEDRFALFAQRITALAAPHAGAHAEVLIRMVAADGSLIPPGAFLPAAERFHLAGRIDRWVLSHAIAWLEKLPSLDVIDTLSVNLSGQSVGDRTFHHWAIEVLGHAGPAVCARLCIEITETAAVTNMQDAASFVDQLRAAGVRISLDDFGAGASSFGYLKTLHVDYLKIDGQFVRGLLSNPLDDVAVRCFAEVAEVLGLKTVAEFVDDPAVLERLRQIGIDFAQGYLIHVPSPLDDLLEEAVATEPQRGPDASRPARSPQSKEPRPPLAEHHGEDLASR